MRITKLIYDGKSFVDYNGKTYNHLFEKELFYLDGHYSFWISHPASKTYRRTIEGIPFINIKQIERKTIPAIDKIKANNSFIELRQIPLNKKDVLNLNYKKYIDVDYGQVKAKYGKVKYNYKFFANFVDLEKENIYIIEIKIINNGLLEKIKDQLEKAKYLPISFGINLNLEIGNGTILEKAESDSYLDLIENFLFDYNKKVAKNHGIRNVFKKGYEEIVEIAENKKVINIGDFKKDKSTREMKMTTLIVGLYIKKIIGNIKTIKDLISILEKNFDNLYKIIEKNVNLFGKKDLIKYKYEELINRVKLENIVSDKKIIKKDLFTNTLKFIKSKKLPFDKKDIREISTSLQKIKGEILKIENRKEKKFISIPYVRNDHLNKIFKNNNIKKTKKQIEESKLGKKTINGLLDILDLLKEGNKNNYKLLTKRGKCIIFYKDTLDKKELLQIKKICEQLSENRK